MRVTFALVLLLPSLAAVQPTAEQKKETIKWITNLQDPNGGFYVARQDPNIDAVPRPSLRATNGAVRSLKYLGADIPNKAKHASFVLKCYDPKTGGFAEPGEKPTAFTTSVGVMAAMELSIPKEKFAKAMDYIKANAKEFEEVRIGAAAVEAWGVKDCPFKLDEWRKIAFAGDTRATELLVASMRPKDGGARIWGSLAAFQLRLELKVMGGGEVIKALRDGQLDDGGWGKNDKASDIESTYRVMRALMLFKEKPKDVKKLRAFVDSHRNKDGGYATTPGEKSSMSGVYYCTIVSTWMDEMEKK